MRAFPVAAVVRCAVYDLKPSKVGLVDTIQTSSSNYGKQKEHYNGVDVTINGRMSSGGMIQGGFNMGRTMTDTCDVIGKLDNPSLMPQPTNAAGGPAALVLDPRCQKQGDWLPQAKLLGSHPLPWDFRISGTYQTLVLDPISNGTSNLGFVANYVATRNGNYGTNGATWLRPGAILPARLLKFGGQLGF